MKALTLTQPWAGLVASGIKLVENRPRAMGAQNIIGQRIAIHASRQIDGAVYERIEVLAPGLGRGDLHPTFAPPWAKLSRVTSAIIGIATIDRVVAWQADAPRLQTAADLKTGAIVDLGDQRRWFFGPVGILLRDVRAIEPIREVKGALGFWTVTPAIAAHVEEQVR